MIGCCCGRKDKKIFNAVWLLIGFVTLLLGIVLKWKFEDASGAAIRGFGMMTGFGTGILAVGIVHTLRDLFSSKEKIREREIEQKDERNIQIIRAAATITMSASFLLFGILSFLFTFMDDIRPALISMAAMYIDIAVFIISTIILQKKM